MGALTSLSKSATSSALGLSEYALLFFSLLVVIGLIGEYRLPSWHHRLKIFEAMVALGCGGELIADGGVFLFSRQLEALANLEISNLSERATKSEGKAKGFEAQISDANARAKKSEAEIARANVLVAEANARAAEARSMAESEKLEREKLAALVQPRLLTLGQQRSIVAVLKKYAGHPQISISSYGLDGEGAALGTQLIAVFKAAGIPVASGLAGSLVSGGFDLGVHVLGPETEQQFVADIGKSLSEQGKLQVFLNVSTQYGGLFGGATMTGGTTFSGGRADQLSGPTKPGSPVMIEIGIKPLPVYVVQ